MDVFNDFNGSSSCNLGSRGAFLFVIFSYIYNLIYVLFSKTINRKIFIFIVSSVIFSLIYAFKTSSNISFSLNRITTVSSYTEDTIRLDLWKRSLEIFYDNPIIGVGLNGANDYLVNNGYHNSHNVFIDILTSGGLLGVLIFITIILLMIRVKKFNLVFILGFVFVMFGPLFFINGFNTLSFWIPFFLVGIISNFLKHNNIEDTLKDFLKLRNE
ncbi:O-antigen ligase family protein [Exiguobacterium sp. SL14]|nr:O-antigen ligase family protein [Exiguobacterium sp. SL14]MCY1689908.1 O-antigen ligase family protein [Exiguobacterium sp. SL14]